MKTRLLSLISALTIIALALPAAPAVSQEVPDPNTLLKPRSCADDAPVCAGYGEADNTWHVGAGAGQYTQKDVVEDPEGKFDSLSEGDIDPHSHSIVQKDSYGVQSRLSFRALVVEDAEGDQTAFVKSDNYLAMDAMLRRVGQILLQNRSNVSYDEIMHMASHNHYSPMYSTASWGVWLFQDVMDLRAFEYQARQMAAAILEAEDNLTAAKMGATTIEHKFYKGMVARRGIADDGTPVGYPLDFGDFGLSVVRFDTLDDQPIGTLVNWGMHPEGLEADNLITAEFLAPLERFVHRATGSNVVFGQGDVGSAESGPSNPYDPEWPKEVPQQWDDAGHAQVERGAFLLARDVIKAYNNIGAGQPSEPPFENNFVPFTEDFDVAAGNAFIPGPKSHPYPGVSNCRSEPTVKGDNGVPITGLPDCDREGPFKDTPLEYPDTPQEVAGPAGMVWDNLQAHGVPVPAHYAPTSFTGVEENLRLKLQAFKLGEVILMSCACEAQVDLILNLESRVDEVEDNLWLGYDWTKRLDCTQPSGDENGDWECRRKADDPNPSLRATFDGVLRFSNAAYERMQAQIYNDAAGWDHPEFVAHAETDPHNTAECTDETWPNCLMGNFTHEELPAELGYKVPIGVGHAGDYNGYTVSYREYMAYDHYRKALTSHGPHTADYMNAELMEMAGELNGADIVSRMQADIDAGDPVGVARELEEEADYTARGNADEARQVAWTTKLGIASAAAYEGWTNTLPNDKGPAGAVEGGQPSDITRFQAATFTWRGGSNAVDNPTVIVERLTDEGWKPFADQSGEIQTMLDFPNGLEGAIASYQGEHEWKWTANFEAFNASPAEIGSTPVGTYRFAVVDGKIRQDFQTVSYATEEEPLYSDEFEVTAWDGLKVRNLEANEDGSVSFSVDSSYPQTYDSVFDYVQVHMREEADRGELREEDKDLWCDTCSFRPWATKGTVETATVTVTRADGTIEHVEAQRGADGIWQADTDLYEGDSASVEPGSVVDNYGESNGEPSTAVQGTRTRPTPTPTESESPTEDPGPSVTELTFTDPSSEAGQFSDTALLEAKLTTDGGATPVAGAEIVFEMVPSSDSWRATTDENGVASVTIDLTQQPNHYDIVARYAGSEDYTASGNLMGFVVEKEDSALTLSPSTGSGKGSKGSGGNGGKVQELSARLSDADDATSPLANELVRFFAGSTFIGEASTNADGVARLTVPDRYKNAGRFEARFDGSNFYLLSTDGWAAGS